MLKTAKNSTTVITMDDVYIFGHCALKLDHFVCADRELQDMFVAYSDRPEAEARQTLDYINAIFLKENKHPLYKDPLLPAHRDSTGKYKNITFIHELGALPDDAFLVARTLAEKGGLIEMKNGEFTVSTIVHDQEMKDMLSGFPKRNMWHIEEIVSDVQSGSRRTYRESPDRKQIAPRELPQSGFQKLLALSPEIERIKGDLCIKDAKYIGWDVALIESLVRRELDQPGMNVPLLAKGLSPVIVSALQVMAKRGLIS